MGSLKEAHKNKIVLLTKEQEYLEMEKRKDEFRFED